jgi:hypothetical protein
MSCNREWRRMREIQTCIFFRGKKLKMRDVVLFYPPGQLTDRKRTKWQADKPIISLFQLVPNAENGEIRF